MHKMIQDKLSTLKKLSDSPEVSKLLGKMGEQGRITGILNYYKEEHPEFTHVFEKIMSEIEEKSNYEYL